MKHVDNSCFAEILFTDVKTDNNFKNAHIDDGHKNVRGNIRIALGLYRTPAEADSYISESLKRKLP